MTPPVPKVLTRAHAKVIRSLGQGLDRVRSVKQAYARIYLQRVSSRSSNGQSSSGPLRTQVGLVDIDDFGEEF